MNLSELCRRGGTGTAAQWISRTVPMLAAGRMYVAVALQLQSLFSQKARQGTVDQRGGKSFAGSSVVSYVLNSGDEVD